MLENCLILLQWEEKRCLYEKILHSNGRKFKKHSEKM